MSWSENLKERCFSSTAAVRDTLLDAWGFVDMSGNAQEWVYDWHSQSYAACGADCLGVDPRGPCGGAEPCTGHRRRVVRGGSWYWPASHSRTYRRRAHMPSNRPYHHFGFRCAASPAEAEALSR